MRGWLRSDGRKGIRNVVVVAYLVECARHVATVVARAARGAGRPRHRLSGLLPERLRARHDGAALHPSQRRGRAAGLARGARASIARALREAIEATGRPVRTLVIQAAGGTRRDGRGRPGLGARSRGAALDAQPHRADGARRADRWGPSAAARTRPAGLTANPAMGRAFDLLVEAGGRGDLRGDGRADRLRAAHGWPCASPPSSAGRSCAAWTRPPATTASMGYASFATGNAEGGLSTIEEKSLGAYAKSGTAPIAGLLKPGDLPPAGRALSHRRRPGRRAAVRVSQHQRQCRDRRADRLRGPRHPVLDRPRLGRGLGDLAGDQGLRQPRTYRRMQEDMDVDAGRILEGRGTLDEVGREILALIQRVAAGDRDLLRGAGAPGVHPRLQALRAHRPRLPAAGGLTAPTAQRGCRRSVQAFRLSSRAVIALAVASSVSVPSAANFWVAWPIITSGRLRILASR